MNQDKNKKLAQVFHYDLYGKREEKYRFLTENNLQTVNWTELKPDSPNYFFVPKDFSSKEEYEKGFKITDLFIVNSVGMTTAKDSILIDDNQNQLLEKVNNFYGIESNKKLIKTINYRPFDNKWIYYDTKLIERSRENVMQHFLKGKNIGLLVARQCVSDWRYVFVTEKICDINLIGTAGAFGCGNVFPLYLWKTFTNSQKANDTKTIETVNLNKTIADKISEVTGLQFMQLNTEILDFDVYAGEVYVKTEDTEKLFDYIYAVLHSRTYREKYKEFLKIDFPRIPYPENVEQFENLAKYGYQLRKLHLMEDVIVPNEMANFTEQGSNEVGQVRHCALDRHCGLDPQSPRVVVRNDKEIAGQARNDGSPLGQARNDDDGRRNDGRTACKDGRVYINDKQFFDNVPEIAWNFYIGGYKPAQKWLKDRKGRTLNYEEIQHYRKIIAVLAETERIMGKIE